ncbi:putative ribonuclease H-like domain-containing protein [Tanacetum coccineum]
MGKMTQGGKRCFGFNREGFGEMARFYTSAGNPVKEILLKLNLPDHRKLKDGGEVKEFQRSFRHSDTERLSRSDEVLKLKNFKKDATLKLFKSTNQERNKARLVVQDHRQEEGIEYEEVFALVARIEAIRLFLDYASFMGFLVYQMDVKGAFLYGTIEEEVYVAQPPGFKDPDHPDKVYKVVKALYGLHQAPRAWYETLANYLLGNGFKRGKIDQTLFIKKQKGDILLVQVYVDDIIFGSTNKDLLQQKEDGIFISQDKYVVEILKKFNYTDVKSTSTPVDLEKPLVKDGDADDVDCKKQTVVTTYTTEVEYVATTSCYGQVITPHVLGSFRDYGLWLISWQCKRQTVATTSTTDVVIWSAAASCAVDKLLKTLVLGSLFDG